VAGFSLDSQAFMAAMREIGPILEIAAMPIIEEKGERIAELAKRWAPVAEEFGGGAYPGELRDSIAVQDVGRDFRGPYVDVGTREPYGLYMEFGTKYVTQRPFMRPAIAEEADTYMSTRLFLAVKTSTPFKRIGRRRQRQ
jgi:hypothetical protein